MLLTITLTSLLTVACSGIPGAPTPVATQTTTAPQQPDPQPAAAGPTYVVIGDSLGLFDQGYWPLIQQAVPARWSSYAVGSTFIHLQWQPEGSAYQRLRANLTTPPTAFLVHLGANDTILHEYHPGSAATIYERPTADSVYEDFRRLVDSLNRDYPGAAIYLADVGQVWTYGDMRTENAAVRAGIERVWAQLPVLRGPLLRDLTPDDGVHFGGADNVRTIAARWIAVLTQ